MNYFDEKLMPQFETHVGYEFPCMHGVLNNGRECVECNKVCECGCLNGDHLIPVEHSDRPGDCCSVCEDCEAFTEAPGARA